ncbi:hypothetical protein CDL15_Pgr024530 [Punica granatum]|uniref:Uncharacterized protein n=1 Tax=Punica granatum TaxID=22663 RepID=A0A218XZS0_PUNGR|nr:hypothetical protein CDL15_Pgr024530 [Punica granatum]
MEEENQWLGGWAIAARRGVLGEPLAALDPWTGAAMAATTWPFWPRAYFGLLGVFDAETEILLAAVVVAAVAEEEEQGDDDERR